MSLLFGWGCVLAADSMIYGIPCNDEQVLRGFPFESVRVDRVVYESAHLGRAGILSAARLMHANGFVSVNAPLTPSPWSVWHHNESTEGLLPP